MYKEINNMEVLYEEMESDKNCSGAESSTRDRYPIRFVLFENFHDFFDFTNECSEHHVVVVKMDTWMRTGDDDNLLTYSQLYGQFKKYIMDYPERDMLIASFSEVTRFYENSENNAEFNSLVMSILRIEAQEQAQQRHQRVYVPIIGMQNKMTRFKNDPTVYMWEYQSQGESRNYRLVLTPGTTYGVSGLKKHYTVCHNVKEWVALWHKGEGVKHQIICCSRSLYDNAEYAQPDNAFDYTVCHSAYDFLKEGLRLDFGNLKEIPGDEKHWEKLASEVDVGVFDFEHYVKNLFNIMSLNSTQDFLQTWLTTKDDYSRWLLKNFYLITHPDDTYLKRVLTKLEKLTKSELFSTIATLIFGEEMNEAALQERALALREGKQNGIKITYTAEKEIEKKLKAMADDPEKGYDVAMKYLSPISDVEKCLMIQWLGQGHIERKDVEMYPDLFHYTLPLNVQLTDNELWVNEYFTEYAKSKVSNATTDRLKALLLEKNASPIAFETWRNDFKTVKTTLIDREDIDVYYWIDGMGVDWIPFITSIIDKHKVDNIYLNEVLVASAQLPTRTENNRIQLEQLCGNKLEKAGDIDQYAHQQKQYPAFMIEEFSKMEEIINKVLIQHNGRKIAFVSDHGISYVACHEPGMDIANIKGDHAGRCGEWKEGVPTNDKNYFILDDGRTICALTHRSLTQKVPEGQGAHGGATPEEVLVPIIIVSNQENASTFTVRLENKVISASSPIVRYVINGLSSIDIPIVLYNDVEYTLRKKGENIYESERLPLVDTATIIKLRIGKFEQQDRLILNTGVEEEELFDF